VLKQVLKTISRYNMLASASPRGEPLRVAVAVSGGPDSMCLLHVLRELAPQFSLALSIAHFNHKLRGAASDADERFVADAAARLGLPFHSGGANVASVNDNLEQAGRKARRRFFAELQRSGTADLIALGHTRDDQAETVLFRLLRGTGTAGLTGILPVTSDGWIRPLIEVTRVEVREYLASHAIQWREDATNLDFRFARNRIRHLLIPQLARDWNPQISGTLANLADVAIEEERWWKAVIDRCAERDFVHVGGEEAAVEVEIPRIASVPRAVARRLIRRAIAEVRGDLRRIEFSHIESVLELAEGTKGEGRRSLPGLEVIRSFDWVRFVKKGLRQVPEEQELRIPGENQLPGSETRIRLEVAQKNGPSPCGTLKAAELDWGQLPAPLVLRGWRAGDRYRPLGEGRERTVAEMLQKARVPSWRRPFWPIVTGAGKIVWAKQFGPAAQFAAVEGSGQVLRLWEVARD
jgi:tRNA(Ile)-lysidine synthase